MPSLIYIDIISYFQDIKLIFILFQWSKKKNFLFKNIYASYLFKLLKSNETNNLKEKLNISYSN